MKNCCDRTKLPLAMNTWVMCEIGDGFLANSFSPLCCCHGNSYFLSSLCSTNHIHLISNTHACQMHPVCHFGKIACEINFSATAVYIFHLANKFALPVVAFVNFLSYSSLMVRNKRKTIKDPEKLKRIRKETRKRWRQKKAQEKAMKSAAAIASNSATIGKKEDQVVTSA